MREDKSPWVWNSLYFFLSNLQLPDLFPLGALHTLLEDYSVYQNAEERST